MANKEVILKEGVDFTRSKFIDFLNKRYKGKISGKPFNSQDVQQYETHGRLPDQYGGHKISTIKNGHIGINLLRVEGLKLTKDEFKLTKDAEPATN